ncbi:MAG: hypothetical protein DWQ06_14680 [Calditrichaeota bacterium]|nr:MAG: hypothetical protein DWQ06_14680 [Calditrichota bacterium]
MKLIFILISFLLVSCSDKKEELQTEESPNAVLKNKPSNRSLRPDSSFLEYTEALRLFDDKKYVEAIPKYLTVLEKDSLNWSAAHEIAISYTTVDSIEKAIFYYEQTMRIKPEFSESYQNAGNLLFTIGRYKEAIEFYEKGFKNTSSDYYTETYNNLATAYYFLGDFKNARKIYKISIESDQSSSIPVYGIGLVEYYAKNYVESEKYLLEAIKIDDNLNAHLTLGMLYFDSGKEKRSKEELEYFLAKVPNSPYAKYAKEKLAELEARNK